MQSIATGSLLALLLARRGSRRSPPRPRAARTRTSGGEKKQGKFHIEYINGKPVTVIDTVVVGVRQGPAPERRLRAHGQEHRLRVGEPEAGLHAAHHRDREESAVLMATARAPQPQPQAAGPRPRILRIGILLGGKIVEERLIRERTPVTIGQSMKNTFSIPVEGLPLEFTLFAIDERQVLAPLPQQDGRPAQRRRRPGQHARRAQGPRRARPRRLLAGAALRQRARQALARRSDDPVPVRHRAAASAQADAARVGARHVRRPLRSAAVGDPRRLDHRPLRDRDHRADRRTSRPATAWPSARTT